MGSVSESYGVAGLEDKFRFVSGALHSPSNQFAQVVDSVLKSRESTAETTS